MALGVQKQPKRHHVSLSFNITYYTAQEDDTCDINEILPVEIWAVSCYTKTVS